MMTFQILNQARAWYYTSSKSDEYYLSDLRIKGEFVGSGLEKFGIQDTEITQDDKRLKHLLNGYTADGEKLLRKGANTVRKYHWFENEEGKPLTIETNFWIGKRDVKAIQTGNFENCSKELKKLSETYQIDESWIQTSKGKKQDYHYLCDPSTGKAVMKEKKYVPTKYDIANLKNKDFKPENISRLSPETEKLLKANGITDPKKAFKTKRVESTPGYDMTFSAPKAVSVLWGLETNKERKEAVFQAHYEAMKDALAFAEQYFVGRSGAGGINLHQVKMVAALIPHFTSREGDMQLHGHGVLANLGLKDNGEFGTLDVRTAMRMQFALGSYYRNALAHNLQALGYELEFRPFEDVSKPVKVPALVRLQGEEKTNEYIKVRLDRREKNLKNYGTSFGIKGISQELEELYSKRTKQIEATGVKGSDDYDKKRKAKFGTRKKKDVTESLESLEAKWLKEARGIIRKGELVPTPNTKVKTISKSSRTETEMKLIYRDTLKRLAYNQQKGGVSLTQIYTALEFASKGMLSAEAFEKAGTHIRSRYLKAHSLEKDTRYSLNQSGKKAVNYRTRIEKLGDMTRKGKQSIQFLKHNSYNNGLLGHLLLGNISVWQYERLIAKKGKNPKSVLHAKLMYAQYKMSRKELKYHLKRLQGKPYNKERFTRFKRATSQNTSLIKLFEQIRIQEQQKKKEELEIKKRNDHSLLISRSL